MIGHFGNNAIEFMKRKHNHEYVFHNPGTGKHISNGAMLVFLKKEFSHFKITVQIYSTVTDLNKTVI